MRHVERFNALFEQKNFARENAPACIFHEAAQLALRPHGAGISREVRTRETANFYVASMKRSEIEPTGASRYFRIRLNNVTAANTTRLMSTMNHHCEYNGAEIEKE